MWGRVRDGEMGWGGSEATLRASKGKLRSSYFIPQVMEACCLENIKPFP